MQCWCFVTFRCLVHALLTFIFDYTPDKLSSYLSGLKGCCSENDFRNIVKTKPKKKVIRVWVGVRGHGKLSLENRPQAWNSRRVNQQRRRWLCNVDSETRFEPTSVEGCVAAVTTRQPRRPRDQETNVHFRNHLSNQMAGKSSRI